MARPFEAPWTLLYHDAKHKMADVRYSAQHVGILFSL
jgi:hypothetical protein